jgi:hypothetical protein
VRFLIDECLSVELVSVAGEAGHEAHHVAHVGRAGWKVDGEMQQRLFQSALEQLAIYAEPINQVLEVDIEGDEATFTFYDLPIAQQ